MDMQERLTYYTKCIETEIAQKFPASTNCAQKTIDNAMHYSMTAGGKRLRPMLTLEFCRVCGGEIAQAMPFAIAMEMIHTYSLIHDDLPCMDNDDVRRGKPTSHKVFGEGMAVLAGDALLTDAMYMMCTAGDAEMVQMAVRDLSKLAGTRGMIGGQVIDLESEGKPISLEQLNELQLMKTGALLEAACRLGCYAAMHKDMQLHTKLDAATDYAQNLGRAFQIQDDILDIEGDSAILGKSIGKDEKNQKSTFPSLLGIARCKALVREYTDAAIHAAQQFDQGDFLAHLAEHLVSRKS